MTLVDLNLSDLEILLASLDLLIEEENDAYDYSILIKKLIEAKNEVAEFESFGED